MTQTETPRASKAPAVILLSGGLDSATTLAIAASMGYETHALSFRYGQRHVIELAAADRVARSRGVRSHTVANIDLGIFGGSALTDDIEIPKDRTGDEMSREIPVTYVPARNTIFLSFALALAEVLHSHDVFIGVNAIDYSWYPDCRPEYIAAYEAMANLATREAVEGHEKLTVHTPLISLTKFEIISRGLALGVDYSETLSCYDPDITGAACGRCDSCSLRLRGFSEHGIPDPARYRTQ